MTRVSAPYAQFTIEKRTREEFTGGVRSLASRYQYDKAKSNLNYLEQYHERIAAIREARSPLQKTAEVAKAASPITVAKAVVFQPISAIAHGILAIAGYAFPSLIIKNGDVIITPRDEKEATLKEKEALKQAVSDDFYKLDDSGKILFSYTDVSNDESSDCTEADTDTEEELEFDRQDRTYVPDEGETDNREQYNLKLDLAEKRKRVDALKAKLEAQEANTESEVTESSDTEDDGIDMEPVTFEIDNETDGYTTETDTAYNSEVEKRSLLKK